MFKALPVRSDNHRNRPGYKADQAEFLGDIKKIVVLSEIGTESKTPVYWIIRSPAVLKTTDRSDRSSVVLFTCFLFPYLTSFLL